MHAFANNFSTFICDFFNMHFNEDKPFEQL